MSDQPISQTLLNSLVSAREAAGLSQSDLAAILGVVPSTVNAIERGRKNTTIRLVEAWAKACGGRLLFVSEDSSDGTVVRLDGLEPHHAQLVENLAATLPRMSPDAVSGLAGMIHGMRQVVSSSEDEEIVTKRLG